MPAAQSFSTTKRIRLRLGLFSVCAYCLAMTQISHAGPLTVYAAGSLSGAISTIATNFTAATGIPVTPTFQPSGTISQEIIAGARPDLFASADTSDPLAVQSAGLSGPVTDFASNRLVAVLAPGYSATSGTLLATLLNPAITLGTSTPVYDPLGDYTQQLFAEANAVVAGAQATLEAKAQELIAGPQFAAGAPPGPTALCIFSTPRTRLTCSLPITRRPSRPSQSTQT